MDHAASKGCAEDLRVDCSGRIDYRAALAAGTNDARLTGIRLYHEGKFKEAIPYFDSGSRVSQARPRDPDQTGRVLYPDESAPGSARRLRPGE